MTTGLLRRLALPAAVAGMALLAAPAAQARVGVFLGFGPGFYAPYYWYPPPLYVPPPVIYTPPPPAQWYTPPPPAYAAPARARSCDAGAYVCPMETPVSPGTTCWCRDNQGGRAYGRAT